MRYTFLSPHQFQSFSPFVDTWIVSGHSPWPLDIATPHGASQFIVTRLCDLVKERFMGRTAEIDLGPMPISCGLSQPLSDLLFAVGGRDICLLIADRFLISERVKWTDEVGRDWLAFDWYHWFRRRVPVERQVDVWLYLCLSNPFYRSSHEFRMTGIAPDTAEGMSIEGERLLRQMVDDIANHVRSLWSERTPTP